MANLYSARLIQLIGPLTSATYTSPVGILTVVRDITVWSRDALATTSAIVIGAEGATLWGTTLGTTFPTRRDSWQGRYVLRPTETLELVAVEGEVDMTASGYQLTSP